MNAELFETTGLTLYQSESYAVHPSDAGPHVAGEHADLHDGGIPHGKVGVTTVGNVRVAGGDVVASPTRNNPNHATLSGITAEQAEALMTPTVRNPSARK